MQRLSERVSTTTFCSFPAFRKGLDALCGCISWLLTGEFAPQAFILFVGLVWTLVVKSACALSGFAEY